MGLNLLSLGDDESASQPSDNSIMRGQNWQVGTYSRKSDLYRTLQSVVTMWT